MWVRFLRNTDVTEHGAGPAFTAGQVADLKVPSAVYWKGIGAAVEAEAPPEPESEIVATPAPQPVPAPIEPPADEPIDIPADWQSLHWKKRVALAGQIAGRDIADKADADAVIAAEIERRAQ